MSCNYCMSSEHIEGICDIKVRGTDGGFWHFNQLTGKYDHVNEFTKIGSDVKINYCPYCGKKWRE